MARATGIDDLFGHVPQADELSLAGKEPSRTPESDELIQIPPSGNTPDAVRENLHRVLAFVRAAEAMPWDARDLRYYSGLVPYMAEWLKNGEGDSLMAQFKAEMDRLQAPDDQVAPNWRRIWGIAE